MIDITLAMIDFLKADSPLAALVGTRVFGGELYESEAPFMPRKAVVLRGSGGASLLSQNYVPVTDQRFDIFSYGETPFEVSKVRRAVFTALKELRRALIGGDVLIHWIEPAGGFVNLRDPDAGWPVNFQSFQALFDERAIA